MLEERRKYPPSLLEDCFIRASASRHEEGIGDISELLDDWGEEDDDRQASQTSYDPLTLQRLIAEMKRQRKAEAFAWDDEDDDDEI